MTTATDMTRAVLGRPEWEFPIPEGLEKERILITGASGSVGQALTAALDGHPNTVATDIDTLDVTKPYGQPTWGQVNPTVIFHLAASKLAPKGEEHPYRTALVNIVGTGNILDHLAGSGCKVILASTCKAGDPETAYGASKLIAERMVLNAGGVACRFYNIFGSADDVFQTWAETPPDQPLLVNGCFRRFISMSEAVGFLLAATTLPTGRYTVRDAAPRPIRKLAELAHPGRETHDAGPRRGDRMSEPLWAKSESGLNVPGWPQLIRIVGQHDRENHE